MARRTGKSVDQNPDNGEDREFLQLLAENLDNIEVFDEYYGYLVEKYKDEVIQAVISYNSDKVEDVFNEAVVNTRQAILNYPEERILNLHIKRYLITVAKRIFWNEWKKTQGTKVVSLISIHHLIEGDIFEFLQDGLFNQPEEQYLQKERAFEIHQAIKAALNRLPAIYRETFHLRFFVEDAEQSLLDDIAKTLGKTTGAIKARISRGLRKFCDLLIEELEKRLGAEEEIVQWMKVVRIQLQQPKQKRGSDTNQAEHLDELDEDQEEEA